MKSDQVRRPAIAAIVCAVYTWSIILQNKNPVPAYNMLGQDKNNPAVPPGLTRMRPTHPYHHTVALFTECRSVAHRAGIPPSDCPPKSIHTIQSVPRSQLRAALCDIHRTGYLLFINGFNSFMKLFWILLLHCDKVKRKFLTCTPPPEAGEYIVLPCDKVTRVFYKDFHRRGQIKKESSGKPELSGDPYGI